MLFRSDEQREIYKAMIEESFGFFKDAIASARGLNEEQMASFTDGRMLTAAQAKELLGATVGGRRTHHAGPDGQSG